MLYYWCSDKQLIQEGGASDVSNYMDKERHDVLSNVSLPGISYGWSVRSDIRAPSEDTMLLK